MKDYLKWDVKQVVKVDVELFAKKDAHIVAMETAKTHVLGTVITLAKAQQQLILNKTELWTSMYPKS